MVILVHLKLNLEMLPQLTEISFHILVSHINILFYSLY